MINKPDFDNAAVQAMELLKKFNITETPINPMPILLSWPGVRVLPYTKMADEAGMERQELVYAFGNQDAATFYIDSPIPGMENVRYVVVYNMRLPFEIIWRAIARELGHIVLGHDGSTRPQSVRMAEAKCFAHHLISPRPIIHQLQSSGMPLTLTVLAETTGCSDECVNDMQKIPGAHVPASLNKEVMDLFSSHINEYISFHSSAVDKSPVIDFGSFMEYYDE